MLNEKISVLKIPNISTCLWPEMWSILENVICSLEENICLLLCGVFYKCELNKFWLIVVFKSSISLRIFYLLVLLIMNREALKITNIIIYVSISPLWFIKFWFICFIALVLL